MDNRVLYIWDTISVILVLKYYLVPGYKQLYPYPWPAHTHAKQVERSPGRQATQVAGWLVDNLIVFGLLMPTQKHARNM